jgi:hypothetical protein
MGINHSFRDRRPCSTRTGANTSVWALDRPMRKNCISASSAATSRAPADTYWLGYPQGGTPTARRSGLQCIIRRCKRRATTADNRSPLAVELTAGIKARRDRATWGSAGGLSSSHFDRSDVDMRSIRVDFGVNETYGRDLMKMRYWGKPERWTGLVVCVRYRIRTSLCSARR